MRRDPVASRTVHADRADKPVRHSVWGHVVDLVVGQ